ncbi:MAG TPA: RNA methyltransferase, partial [Rhodothermales bacterium]|nr:RNA methyltransferase [Rhodothermales bacterium]
KQHMAPLNAAAIKASAGMANRMRVARAGNLAEVLFQLKERGYWVVGAAGEGATSVWDMDWDRPLAIVLGSEGTGLRQRIAETCDYLVSIPMDAAAESLNVSVAAGILLFAAARVRLEEDA